MDNQILSANFDRVVATYAYQMGDLEACLKVKNIRQLTDKALISALQSRLMDANNTIESKRLAESNQAENQIIERSNILSQENGFLRDQNFKLSQQLNKNKEDSRKLQADLRKNMARNTDLETRKEYLLEELRYLRAMKQTCIIGNNPRKLKESRIVQPNKIGVIMPAVFSEEQQLQFDPLDREKTAADQRSGLSHIFKEITPVDLKNTASSAEEKQKFQQEAKIFMETGKGGMLDLFELRRAQPRRPTRSPNT